MNRSVTCNGMTLLGMMVSLGVSSLLMTGLLSFWYAQYRNGLWLQEATYLRQQGYAVHALMQHVLFQAGYSGCVHWSNRYLTMEPIQVLSPNDVHGIHSEYDGLEVHYWQAIPNTQILAIQSNSIVVEGSIDWDRMRFLVVHDCNQWVSLSIQAVRRSKNQALILLKKPIPLSWQQPQLAVFCQEQWVVAKTKRVNRLGHPIWGLFQRQHDEPWQERVSDVYGLHIHLSQPIYLEFIIGSDRELDHDQKPIPFGNTYFYPPDHRWYQRWQLAV